MTGYELTKALSLTDERFLEEAEQRGGILPLRRVPAAVAAVVVLFAAAWSVYVYAGLREPMLITGQDVNRCIEACYATPPRDGTVHYAVFVYSTVEQYAAQNARYWLKLDVFDDTGDIGFSKDKAYAEATRLTEAGYDIYILDKDWIGYWGEDKHHTTICGIFTKKQLDTLLTRDDYGYFIDFVEGVMPEDCVAFGK